MDVYKVLQVGRNATIGEVSSKVEYRGLQMLFVFSDVYLDSV